MDEDFDKIAEGLVDRLHEWLAAENRELSSYSVRRFVCAELDGTPSIVRLKVSDSLYDMAKRGPLRYADQGSW
jgi:hypothetical protein